jgi:hypothetical protein
MTIQRRDMHRRDINQCVQLVASHPILGPRYGRKVSKLGDTWRDLLGREAFRAVVFETLGGDDRAVVGMGVSVFIADQFARKLKIPPFFWLGSMPNR